MSNGWCLSAMLVLALPISATAQASECAHYLKSDMPGAYSSCMAGSEPPALPESTQEKLRAVPGLDAHPYGQRQQQQRIYQSDPEYRQRHDQNMILNHGMGGCTPNFSTGGCL